MTVIDSAVQLLAVHAFRARAQRILGAAYIYGVRAEMQRRLKSVEVARRGKQFYQIILLTAMPSPKS